MKTGDMVKWKWGEGHAQGKITDIYPQRTLRVIDGTEVMRNGTPEDPAILIQQEDGQKVLKLQSELTLVM